MCWRCVHRGSNYVGRGGGANGRGAEGRQISFPNSLLTPGTGEGSERTSGRRWPQRCVTRRMQEPDSPECWRPSKSLQVFWSKSVVEKAMSMRSQVDWQSRTMFSGTVRCRETLRASSAKGWHDGFGVSRSLLPSVGSYTVRSSSLWTAHLFCCSCAVIDPNKAHKLIGRWLNHDHGQPWRWLDEKSSFLRPTLKSELISTSDSLFLRTACINIFSIRTSVFTWSILIMWRHVSQLFRANTGEDTRQKSWLRLGRARKNNRARQKCAESLLQSFWAREKQNWLIDLFGFEVWVPIKMNWGLMSGGVFVSGSESKLWSVLRLVRERPDEVPSTKLRHLLVEISWRLTSIAVWGFSDRKEADTWRGSVPKCSCICITRQQHEGLTVIELKE